MKRQEYFLYAKKTKRTTLFNNSSPHTDTLFSFKSNCKQTYRGVKSTGKPYLSKSTDTLQWKLLHYKLQVTNSKTTWVKVLEYLILTVLKYFTYTKYRLKDALVKETWQLKTVTLWKSWGKQAEARIHVQAFHGKTRTNKKPKTKGNKEQNDGQTDNHYIQQLTKN